MMKPEGKRTITIEDLLRLKRAERPPAEFWAEFDRALRAKQLAALVEKRPWWQTMPRFFVGFRRYRIPIGAAAVAAATFFSLRDHHGNPAPLESAPPASMPAAAVNAPVAVAPETDRDIAAVAAHRAETALSSESAAASTSEAAAVALASEATSPGGISRIIPLIGAAAEDANEEELSPSARVIAANLATVRGSEPVLTRTLLSKAHAAETRAPRPAVELLQQIASPGDRRRSNLFTAMVSMPAFEGPTRNAERVAARLSQDELYDRIHRFGARANAVNMKF